MRVGIGYDSHRFAEGRPLILAGVHIPHDRGLAGHSDADAAAHAVTDALLGAAALGDIGAHFPPSDERWRDADSMVLLERVVTLLRDGGLVPLNVDVTVICEAPRLGPHVDAMRTRLASALGLDARAVSIKAKTNEGMGWVGRGEGLAALAVASVTTA
ncbi:MAG TPA: 2-C-methyl-D-erythritol 2,4-cyclodiphosphate synthase [Longimicrobiales bacterium]|nr:2-C-methyl-D-erythritol 2,4-cyclodiphosphate synthase [Longimicrobiales bacterium]